MDSAWLHDDDDTVNIGNTSLLGTNQAAGTKRATRGTQKNTLFFCLTLLINRLVTASGRGHWASIDIVAPQLMLNYCEGCAVDGWDLRSRVGVTRIERQKSQ